jgi:hypothetical protein
MADRASASFETMSLSPPLARYVVDAKAPHRELQCALTQLSAFLLKRLTGGRAGAVDYGPVETARTALAECVRTLTDLPVPAGAAHHRRHLDGASAALSQALDAAGSRRGPDEDRMFAALEQAERHLKAVSRILPGFEPVDFSQACCAAHGLLRYDRTAAPA